MRYFKRYEFLCTCGCRQENMSNFFLKMLDDTRHISKIPFVVNSGYRCEQKQQQLRNDGYFTTKNTSPHEKGLAADIRIRNSYERFIVINSWLLIGGTRLGISKSFIHLDVDYDRKMHKIWYYI